MANETESKDIQQWETLNPISSMQEILGTMQALEQNYFLAKKLEEEINNQQSDLLHALELDLDRKEVNAVNKALRELRIKRRDIKDILINLSEAQNFVKSNYKFMTECTELIKKMQRTTQKVASRKYYLRDCEALGKIINMEKFSDIIHTYTPQEEREQVNLEVLSQVEKFNKKWGKK